MTTRPEADQGWQVQATKTYYKQLCCNLKQDIREYGVARAAGVFPVAGRDREAEGGDKTEGKRALVAVARKEKEDGRGAAN
eukprot:gene13605-15017_t